MARFGCALLVLAIGFVCSVHGLRIDPPTLVRPGKYFAADSAPRNTMLDDPRCSAGDGLYAHPDDCTRYFACSKGVSQERECPKGFRFDSRRHCTPSKNADCGKKQTSSSPAFVPTCPDYYGYFSDQEDCHKFIVCEEGIATVRKCPEGQVYDDHVGACEDGTVCPKTHAESSACQRADGLFPHKDCLRYFKCVNFVPQAKSCLKGKAFDPKKEACTREQFSRCKNNDMQSFMRSD